MNQQKIGTFLKTLRKEKGLTQEQFAEMLQVSSRTVSRWENGNNMPDIDLLIQISDYYEIDLRDLLDGERRSEKMDKKMEETVLKAVDYSNMEKEKHTKKFHWLFVAGVVCWFISQIIARTSLVNIYVLYALSEFTAGAACGMMILGVLTTTQYGQKLKSFKQRLSKRQY